VKKFEQAFDVSMKCSVGTERVGVPVMRKIKKRIAVT